MGLSLKLPGFAWRQIVPFNPFCLGDVLSMPAPGVRFVDGGFAIFCDEPWTASREAFRTVDNAAWAGVRPPAALAKADIHGLGSWR